MFWGGGSGSYRIGFRQTGGRGPALRAQHDLERLVSIIDLVCLGDIVERHVVGHEWGRIKRSSRQHAEHAVHMADHVRVPALQRERLDPDQAHVYLARLRVDADRDDRPGLAGEADCELERVWMTDGVDRRVDAAISGQLPDDRTRVL